MLSINLQIPQFGVSYISKAFWLVYNLAYILLNSSRFFFIIYLNSSRFCYIIYLISSLVSSIAFRLASMIFWLVSITPYILSMFFWLVSIAPYILLNSSPFFFIIYSSVPRVSMSSCRVYLDSSCISRTISKSSFVEGYDVIK